MCRGSAGRAKLLYYGSNFLYHGSNFLHYRTISFITGTILFTVGTTSSPTQTSSPREQLSLVRWHLSPLLEQLSLHTMKTILLSIQQQLPLLREQYFLCHGNNFLSTSITFLLAADTSSTMGWTLYDFANFCEYGSKLFYYRSNLLFGLSSYWEQRDSITGTCKFTTGARSRTVNFFFVVGAISALTWEILWT